MWYDKIVDSKTKWHFGHIDECGDGVFYKSGICFIFYPFAAPYDNGKLSITRERRVPFIIDDPLLTDKMTYYGSCPGLKIDKTIDVHNPHTGTDKTVFGAFYPLYADNTIEYFIGNPQPYTETE